MTSTSEHETASAVNGSAIARRASIALRPYQHEAIEALDEGWRRGLLRSLITLPTGTGKTVIAAGAAQRRGGRALFLAHRDELIQQTAHTFEMVMPDADIGIVKAERDEADASIVVASIQTLARASRRNRCGAFDLVIVDEAHHARAETFVDVIEHFAPRGSEVPVLGLTATPDRGDGRGLDAVFDEIVYTFDLRDAIRAGYLATPRALRLRLALDLNAVHVRHGDLDAQELEAALRAANAGPHALAAFQRHAADRHAVIFAPSVELAHDIATLFRGAGIDAAAVDGEMALADRRALLARFERGELRVIVNCMLLTEGWDAPIADCAIVLRPTMSRALYAQMVGRVLRPFPTKADALVIDLANNTTRHRLMSIASLLGVADAKPRGDNPIDDTRTAGAPTMRQRALSIEAELIAERVDLLEAAAPLHWLPVASTRFVLPAGEHGFLLLDAAGAQTWRVRFCPRTGASTTIAEGLPLDYAAGAGSDYARALGADAFIKSAARWRSHPASERQLDALRRCRLPAPLGITKGQAADALTIAAARRVR